jgi:predicted nucleic acid-binding Zn ribbon protein
MVCPVCIIPVIGGATALSTGSRLFSKNITKNIKYVLLFFTVFLILISIYFLVYRKKLAENCDTCKIPEDETPA